MSSSSSIYLPHSNTPSIWRLDILGAGSAEIQPGQEYPPHKHPTGHYFSWENGRSLTEYQAILITEGKGIFETELTKPITFEAPALFILFPGVWHRYQPQPETGWREHWVAFDGEHAHELKAGGIIDPSTPFYEVGHSEALLSQFQHVHAEAKAEALGYRRICAAAIMQILALATILPVRAEEERQPMRSVIRKACFKMRERSDRALSPETLAAELNVGYTYFRRLFKKYTGVSPKRYHAQLRLLKAKSLLRDTNLSIGEIANALAFDTPFHLSSWFKKQVGKSPSDWR